MVDIGVLEFSVCVLEFCVDIGLLTGPRVAKVDKVPFIDLVLMGDILRDIWVTISEKKIN